MSSPLDLSGANSDGPREATTEVAIALLVQAMGGSVVFGATELLPVFDAIQNGRMRVVIHQYSDPWQVRFQLEET